MSDYKRDEWTVDEYEGQFEPSASGPDNISVEVSAQFIDVEHEVASDYWSGSTSLVRVRLPREWLEAAIAAFDAHRAKGGSS